MTWRDNRTKITLGLLGVFFLAVLVLSAWVFPSLLVEHDRAGAHLDAKDLVSAKNDARTTLLQGLAAAFFLVTAIFTWLQVRNSQRQLDVDRRQLALSEEGQITERFSRGVDQLGHTELDVRLGGIYALERIARHSAYDDQVIMDVLTAYLRVHVPWPTEDEFAGGLKADVQAVLTVLKRRNPHDQRRSREPVDLSSVDLRRSDLQRVLLENANLSNAHLEGADLREAHLEGAKLTCAALDHANLHGARLDGAVLTEASLNEADLENASLMGADLRGASLQGTRLAGVLAAGTQWPSGFDLARTKPTDFLQR